MELLIKFISFLIFCIKMSPFIFVLFFQDYITKRFNNKSTYILPIISFFISVIVTLMTYNRYFIQPLVELRNLINSIILTFTILNIPTILLVIVTMYSKKKLETRRE